jgi:hypothetical protein
MDNVSKNDVDRTSFKNLLKFKKTQLPKYAKDPDGNEYNYTIMDLANMQKEN